MRHTADTINDDELDALYERLERAEGAVERVLQLGNVLRAADAPDGTPSPLRPVGELIVAVASRTFTEAATGIVWARDCHGNAIPAAHEQEAGR
ncbi:hypothetical protein [Streptomyces sp. NPDC056682]|uniref:hypothetical protein n=1 Tax=Streptomyces sp. NPDC056682 TaxID=3345909 RepID=UPI0036C3A539